MLTWKIDCKTQWLDEGGSNIFFSIQTRVTAWVAFPFWGWLQSLKTSRLTSLGLQSPKKLIGSMLPAVPSKQNYTKGRRRLSFWGWRPISRCQPPKEALSFRDCKITPSQKKKKRPQNIPQEIHNEATWPKPPQRRSALSFVQVL